VQVDGDGCVVVLHDRHDVIVEEIRFVRSVAYGARSRTARRRVPQVHRRPAALARVLLRDVVVPARQQPERRVEPAARWQVVGVRHAPVKLPNEVRLVSFVFFPVRAACGSGGDGVQG